MISKSSKLLLLLQPAQLLHSIQWLLIDQKILIDYSQTSHPCITFCGLHVP